MSPGSSHTRRLARYGRALAGVGLAVAVVASLLGGVAVQRATSSIERPRAAVRSSAEPSSSACRRLAAQATGPMSRRSGRFFEADVPRGWTEQVGPSASMFRDPSGERALLIGEVPIPADQARTSLEVAVRSAIEEQRGSMRRGLPGIKLDDVRYDVSDVEVVACWSAHAKASSGTRETFHALVGRNRSEGGMRLAFVSLQSTLDSAEATEILGARVLAGLDVASLASRVSFSPRAVAELRRFLRPGDVVWLDTKPIAPRRFAYDLSVASPDDLARSPAHDRVEVDGIPLLIERESRTQLPRRVVIEWDAANATFLFDGGAPR